MVTLNITEPVEKPEKRTSSNTNQRIKTQLFGAKSLTFLGHILSAEGITPDPTKVEAIINMPIPKSKAVFNSS